MTGNLRPDTYGYWAFLGYPLRKTRIQASVRKSNLDFRCNKGPHNLLKIMQDGVSTSHLASLHTSDIHALLANYAVTTEATRTLMRSAALRDTSFGQTLGSRLFIMRGNTRP